jgi:cellulose synthase/poly-beta-1,6-N-acetylglucosamine synthase-like glycosyltransferase
MTLHRVAQLPPESSAKQVPTPRQTRLAGLVFGLAAIGLVVLPGLTWSLVLSLLAIIFFCVAVLRWVALRWLMKKDERTRFMSPVEKSLPDDALPSYSVLVPLYREANVIGDIVEALTALDYPSAKLEILLILEAVDEETRAAVDAINLPERVSVVVVPDATPRTKPAALNYALKYVSGECLVVYDAEDVPDPNQLRRAASMLSHDPGIGCVQACLNVYNARESFLTRGIA